METGVLDDMLRTVKKRRRPMGDRALTAMNLPLGAYTKQENAKPLKTDNEINSKKEDDIWIDHSVGIIGEISSQNDINSRVQEANNVKKNNEDFKNSILSNKIDI